MMWLSSLFVRHLPTPRLPRRRHGVARCAPPAHGLRTLPQTSSAAASSPVASSHARCGGGPRAQRICIRACVRNGYAAPPRISTGVAAPWSEGAHHRHGAALAGKQQCARCRRGRHGVQATWPGAERAPQFRAGSQASRTHWAAAATESGFFFTSRRPGMHARVAAVVAAPAPCLLRGPCRHLTLPMSVTLVTRSYPSSLWSWRSVRYRVCGRSSISRGQTRRGHRWRCVWPPSWAELRSQATGAITPTPPTYTSTRRTTRCCSRSPKPERAGAPQWTTLWCAFGPLGARLWP